MDSKGRVRTRPERREVLLDEFERSGTSAAAFAKLIGVKYTTFAFWVQRRRRLGREGGERKPVQAAPVTRWVEAALESKEPGGAEALRVELPSGAHVVIGSSAQGWAGMRES
jgi:hypothetical protein